jgi:hypothetical protein
MEFHRHAGRQRHRLQQGCNAATVSQVLDSDQENAASIFSNPKRGQYWRGFCVSAGRLPTSLSTDAVDTSGWPPRKTGRPGREAGTTGHNRPSQQAAHAALPLPSTA